MAVSNPDEELNAKLDPLLGPKLPVAAVTNKGKQVVSDDSSATVTAVAIPTDPNESPPAPSVIRAGP